MTNTPQGVPGQNDHISKSYGKDTISKYDLPLAIAQRQ
ncbi:unnamed protein product [Acidithrix sp. C25]|nr:unnamed protein product [Acidithrix sp. C25]